MPVLPNPEALGFMNFKLLALGLTAEVINILPVVAKSTFVFFLMALLRLNKLG